MMPKTQTKKLCIILVILVVGGIGVWYGVFSYIRHAVAVAAISELKFQEKASEEGRDRSLKAFLADIGSSTSSLDERIVKAGGAVSFIESVELLAHDKKLGVTINSVEIDPDSPDKGAYEYLKLNLTSQGSWKDTFAFISMLESLPQKVKLNSVGLTQTTITDSSSKKPVIQSQWKADIEIEALKEKEN